MNNNRTPQALVVDLDGTLLHKEIAEIAVPGRTSYRYLSRKSANILAKISKLIPIVIATARNANNVKQLVQKIPEVHFSGFVTENGLVAKKCLDETSIYPINWDGFMDLLPNWLQLSDYENCLGLIPPASCNNGAFFLQKILLNNNINGYIYLDGHKIFIYPSIPSKLIGLQLLKILPLIALGNDLNDLDMLNSSIYTATLMTAHEQVKETVNSKGGYCSSLFSHAGTEELLVWAYELVVHLSNDSNLKPV
ncbi:HAD hydrolase family protein [Calothrix sp. FACHB-156]|nr:HAD hydrolase family protein [Calothrix sp. FACHB-156]